MHGCYSETVAIIRTLKIMSTESIPRAQTDSLNFGTPYHQLIYHYLL